MLSGPSLMVVSDLEDMFIPLASGFLVDPVESRSQIEALLSAHPRHVRSTARRQSRRYGISDQRRCLWIGKSCPFIVWPQILTRRSVRSAGKSTSSLHPYRPLARANSPPEMIPVLQIQTRNVPSSPLPTPSGEF